MTEDGRAPVQYVEPLPDTAMQRRMAAGHAMRLGHAENAVHVSADGVLWHKLRLCCGDTMPATVPTWEGVTPTPATPHTEGSHNEL